MRPALLEKRIEEASLNSWPALQQVLFDGWILRFSKGYTKRANSVNPVFDSSIDVREKIDTCEMLYDEKGLPCIFRITPFSSPLNLDQVLASRDYTKIDMTLVLDLDLRQGISPPEPPVGASEESLDDWMRAFCRISQSSPERQRTHREILQVIPSKRYLASLAVSDQVVSCGMGVWDNGMFGLFDIVTDPQHRNKGYAMQLTSLLLKWAQEDGANRAYLQVVSGNAPARHLYANLGFQEAYRYWYRVPNT